MPSARPCPLATTRATMNAVSQHLRVHHGRALLLGRLLRHTAARRRLSASVAPAEVSVAPHEEGEAVLLDVGGMKCGGCSAAVKRILSARPEVAGLSVNLLTESAAVRVRQGAADADGAELARQFADALTAKGFPSKPRDTSEGSLLEGTDETEASRAAELRTGVLNLGLAWGLVALCCTHHAGHMLHGTGLHELAHSPLLHAMGSPVASAPLGALALLGPGRKILVDGVLALVRGHPDMNSLVGLGAATSFTAGAAAMLVPGVGLEPSFLEEPVMLLAIVLLGRTLEARARLRATADLRSLAKLIPARARMVLGAAAEQAAAAAANPAAHASHEDTATVATASVRAGDVLRVLPGERVPVDGVVTAGRSAVDESMLTGESVLVAKAQGHKVTAGTVNYEGPVTVRATSTGADATLAGIARLVADAQAREAPIQRLADGVAGRFCYGVMASSAATFAFWELAGPLLFPDTVAAVPGGVLALSVKLAVDVLVVACPCALGLATPTAVLVASSMGAQRGLLLRGGDVLERCAAVDTVVFDKTGTLTEGRLRVQAVLPAGGASEEEVLRVAAAAERTTRHPVADALLNAAEQRGLTLPPVENSFTEPGAGVRGTLDGRRVAVGQLRWVRAAVGGAQDDDDQPSTSGRSFEEAAAGQTVVYCGVEGRGVLGAIALSDSLRSDARRTVRRLRDLGIQVMVLSGDNAAAARALAGRAGVAASNVTAGVGPGGKVDFVEQLKRGGAVVAMVGDGVNDAPALAAADVGIAVSSSLEAASQAASVVLLGNRLSQVPQALELGRRTVGNIRQNLTWALAYNLVGIPLAAGALLPGYGIALSPSVAGGMMAFSSVAVVANSLRLRLMPAAPDDESMQGSGALHRTRSVDV